MAEGEVSNVEAVGDLVIADGSNGAEMLGSDIPSRRAALVEVRGGVAGLIVGMEGDRNGVRSSCCGSNSDPPLLTGVLGILDGSICCLGNPP
jgi:hypothetical protein